MADSRSARRLFPLKTIGDVCELFRSQLRCDRRPNLAQLSIVAGLIESALTGSRDSAAAKEDDHYSFNNQYSMSGGQSMSAPMAVQIPHIAYNTVEALMHKFTTQIKGMSMLICVPRFFLLLSGYQLMRIN